MFGRLVVPSLTSSLMAISLMALCRAKILSWLRWLTAWEFCPPSGGRNGKVEAITSQATGHRKPGSPPTILGRRSRLHYRYRIYDLAEGTNL